MNTNSYYVGGDVSKGYCNFVILDQAKHVLEPDFQLDDTPEGHLKLSSILMSLRRSGPKASIYVGLESTGGYENNWYHQLWKLKDTLNLYVTRLNPVVINHHKKASMERNDTDKISAKKIADYLIAYPDVPCYNTEDPFSAMRRQWKFIHLLKKQKAQLKKQLESLLYSAHPQLIKYWDENLSEWFLKTLIAFPTAKELARTNVKDLSAIPYVTQSRAKELICDAQESVASATEYWIGYSIKSLAEQILAQTKTICNLEKEIIQSYAFPEMEILTSFPGIGKLSAFGLMIEIGSIDRFTSAKKLSSFFGLHPVFKESGDGKMAPRMSKKGRKEPRWILYCVALSAITCNPMIKTLYEGYVMRGKKKMVAIGMIMHKILRIIYGMLKNNSKFDPQIDQENRDRKNTQNGTGLPKKESKCRRYQQYDTDAPISRRQDKKRKLHDNLLVNTEATNPTDKNENIALG